MPNHLPTGWVSPDSKPPRRRNLPVNVGVIYTNARGEAALSVGRWSTPDEDIHFWSVYWGGIFPDECQAVLAWTPVPISSELCLSAGTWIAEYNNNQQRPAEKQASLTHSTTQ